MNSSTSSCIPLISKSISQEKSTIVKSCGKSSLKRSASLLKMRRIVPVGILMGQTGTGKTTLLNKICGTKFKSGCNKDSMTRHLFKSSSNVGADSFDLIDTPGTDSKIETYKHAVLLREALTTCEFNTIFVIVKYENRYDKILDNFLHAQAPVYNYERKIVIMISHWDMSKNPDQERKEIEDLLGAYSSNIIFYSEKSDSEVIANLMYSCLSGMEKEMLKIEDEEFFMNFNIYEIRTNMIKDYHLYKKSLDKLDKEFQNLSLCKEIEAKDKDEFLHSLIVSFKVESERLLEEFQIKYEKEMTGIDYYTSWIRLQKDCVKLNDIFSHTISMQMSYDLNDKQNPRNLIKKCPGCDLIWFKTEGCDGGTNCGNRVSSFYDILKTCWLKFEFFRQRNGSFKWVKKSMNLISKRNPESNEFGEEGVGCGVPFVWRDLPELGEKKLLELFHAKSLEEVKHILTKEDFQQKRYQYERQIDRNFYS